MGCSRTLAGSSRLLSSRQKESTSAAQRIDSQQLVEETLHYSVNIRLALKNPVGIGEREDRQARGNVTRPDSGFQGIWVVVVAVIRQQVKLPLLAYLPHVDVRVIRGQANVVESKKAYVQVIP